jgi:hypothetical protein
LTDLAAILETLDEEDAKTIRAAMEEKDALARDKERLARDLKLATDTGLREKFPRAFMAYDKKMLDLGNALSEEEITAQFKAKEAELVALGVPISTPPTATAQPAAATETPPDPAAAFGTPVGGPATPSAARNLEAEFDEKMKSADPTDRLGLIEIINDMSKDERERVTERLSAPPSPLMRRARGL